MWIHVIGIGLVGALTFAPPPAQAQTTQNASSQDTPAQSAESTPPELTVLNVALAESVQNREPVGSVNPAVSCETKKKSTSKAATPVVDTAVNGQVYFWNTVQAPTDGKLRHTWLMKKNNEWQPMAKIDLRIGKSNSYRTWSSKKFDPSWHRGEWRIEVANADNTNEVLCESHFRVQ